jgi:hypothetical protein
MMRAQEIWKLEGDEFWRHLVIPEEDRPLFTTAKWEGGYRWFRSPKILDLESYRHEHLKRHIEVYDA